MHSCVIRHFYLFILFVIIIIILFFLFLNFISVLHPSFLFPLFLSFFRLRRQNIAVAAVLRKSVQREPQHNHSGQLLAQAAACRRESCYTEHLGAYFTLTKSCRSIIDSLCAKRVLTLSISRRVFLIKDVVIFLLFSFYCLVVIII